MKNLSRSVCVTFTLVSIIFTTSFSSAAESADSVLKGADIPALKNLDYPELQVVPRATDRLFQEAATERSLGYWNNWTIETAAITTLLAGYMHNNKYKDTNPTETQQRDSNYAAYGAMGVGALWLGISYYLYQAEPYMASANQVRAIKLTDKKSELLRERMAEEALERPAKNMGTLTNLAVISNFLGSVYVMSYAHPDTKLYAGVGILASMLPWVFSNRYVDNYNKHLEYKKRIFTPLSMTTVVPVQTADKSWDLQPQVLLTWKF